MYLEDVDCTFVDLGRKVSVGNPGRLGHCLEPGTSDRPHWGIEQEPVRPPVRIQ